MAELDWTDSQWQQVNAAVNEGFSRASVASFLPCLGPLPGSAETVRNDRLQLARNKITLDRDGSVQQPANMKFVNLTVQVELTSEQVADDTLSNALLAFRRAANVLALEEDYIVFNGHQRGPANAPRNPMIANRPGPMQGLADPSIRRANFQPLNTAPGLDIAVVNAVVAAIQVLENSFHPGPFACILGTELYKAVYSPTPNLQLAADTIKPLLMGAPLLRSGQMNPYVGIVVSLAGNDIDIVVAVPPTAQFIQRKEDATFLFRVYERFVLRIRDKGLGSNLPVRGFMQPLQADTADLIDFARKVLSS